MPEAPKQALPPRQTDALCAECGERFPFNSEMKKRVRELAALGIVPDGFLCEPCAVESDSRSTWQKRVHQTGDFDA
jgi:hypothetical protein